MSGRIIGSTICLLIGVGFIADGANDDSLFLVMTGYLLLLFVPALIVGEIRKGSKPMKQKREFRVKINLPDTNEVHQVAEIERLLDEVTAGLFQRRQSGRLFNSDGNEVGEFYFVDD